MLIVGGIVFNKHKFYFLSGVKPKDRYLVKRLQLYINCGARQNKLKCQIMHKSTDVYMVIYTSVIKANLTLYLLDNFECFFVVC